MADSVSNPDVQTASQALAAILGKTVTEEDAAKQLAHADEILKEYWQERQGKLMAEIGHLPKISKIGEIQLEMHSWIHMNLAYTQSEDEKQKGQYRIISVFNDLDRTGSRGGRFDFTDDKSFILTEAQINNTALMKLIYDVKEKAAIERQEKQESQKADTDAQAASQALTAILGKSVTEEDAAKQLAKYIEDVLKNHPSNVEVTANIGPLRAVKLENQTRSIGEIQLDSRRLNMNFKYTQSDAEKQKGQYRIVGVDNKDPEGFSGDRLSFTDDKSFVLTETQIKNAALMGLVNDALNQESDERERNQVPPGDINKVREWEMWLGGLNNYSDPKGAERFIKDAVGKRGEELSVKFPADYYKDGHFSREPVIVPILDGEGKQTGEIQIKYDRADGFDENNDTVFHVMSVDGKMSPVPITISISSMRDPRMVASLLELPNNPYWKANVTAGASKGINTPKEADSFSDSDKQTASQALAAILGEDFKAEDADKRLKKAAKEVKGEDFSQSLSVTTNSDKKFIDIFDKLKHGMLELTYTKPDPQGNEYSILGVYAIAGEHPAPSYDKSKAFVLTKEQFENPVLMRLLLDAAIESGDKEDKRRVEYEKVGKWLGAVAHGNYPNMISPGTYIKRAVELHGADHIQAQFPDKSSEVSQEIAVHDKNNTSGYAKLTLQRAGKLKPDEDFPKYNVLAIDGVTLHTPVVVDSLDLMDKALVAALLELPKSDYYKAGAPVEPAKSDKLTNTSKPKDKEPLKSGPADTPSKQDAPAPKPDDKKSSEQPKPPESPGPAPDKNNPLTLGGGIGAVALGAVGLSGMSYLAGGFSSITSSIVTLLVTAGAAVGGLFLGHMIEKQYAVSKDTPTDKKPEGNTGLTPSQSETQTRTTGLGFPEQFPPQNHLPLNRAIKAEQRL